MENEEGGPCGETTLSWIVSWVGLASPLRKGFAFLDADRSKYRLKVGKL